MEQKKRKETQKRRMGEEGKVDEKKPCRCVARCISRPETPIGEDSWMRILLIGAFCIAGGDTALQESKCILPCLKEPTENDRNKF
ncbi:PREDICTED: uncharacterized protein LOC106740622 isoform X2 [Dinoponera quadriceps]|uniref:Uncharacterized protein LOC106740622 isoform X2 n=1 Tax=Dinoponera quadriceps TaxID=609295 RepID=A0A6P3WMK6_DINQU|nr:PREDICTED: uncharacterized protein LOC106740622 isoform X2 [Dinoponera quadriceps]